jgi:hypothetical protein
VHPVKAGGRDPLPAGGRAVPGPAIDQDLALARAIDITYDTTDALSVNEDVPADGRTTSATATASSRPGMPHWSGRPAGARDRTGGDALS